MKIFLESNPLNPEQLVLHTRFPVTTEFMNYFSDVEGVASLNVFRYKMTFIKGKLFSVEDVTNNVKDRVNRWLTDKDFAVQKTSDIREKSPEFVPPKPKEPNSVIEDHNIKDLENQLQLALAEENYEKAAELRDKIRTQKNKTL